METTQVETTWPVDLDLCRLILENIYRWCARLGCLPNIDASIEAHNTFDDPWRSFRTWWLESRKEKYQTLDDDDRETAWIALITIGDLLKKLILEGTALDDLVANAYDQVICATEDGRLASVHESARRGDTIMVIEDASTPFLMRRVEGFDRRDENVPCRIVGPCYVYGLMYGAALSEIDQMRDIHIV